MALFVKNVFESLKTFKNPKNFICYSPKTQKTNYTKNRSKTNICYNEAELLLAIDFIIDNAFIVFHDKVYRQVVGIPMGTNCAPFVANIYLHTFEYEYLKKLINNGELNIARLLSNTFRYQDDCIAVNDGGVFGEHFGRMYQGSMMELKPTNLTRDKCTFLDLTISIYRGTFLYHSYDKRNDFSFQVVNYPNLHGNIPSSQSYGVFTSQLVRFCHVNKTVKYFNEDVAKLVRTLLLQGFEKEILLSRYNRFCNNYRYLWAKFNINLQDTKIINTIFPT